jgi:phosphopantetheine--protein transferase-like protein
MSDAGIRAGTDIVNVADIAALKLNALAFERTFSAGERAWCEARGADALPALARMFAAKEAIIKAMEAEEGHFRNIEVFHDANGCPRVRWSKLPRNCRVSLSMAYSEPFAIAVVAIHIPDSVAAPSEPF